MRGNIPKDMPSPVGCDKEQVPKTKNKNHAAGKTIRSSNRLPNLPPKGRGTPESGLLTLSAHSVMNLKTGIDGHTEFAETLH